MDTPYPYPHSLPYDGGQGLHDSSHMSAWMESLSNEHGSCDDGAGPAYFPAPNLGGYTDLTMECPGFVPSAGSDDTVVAPPGPANFFDGNPALGS